MNQTGLVILLIFGCFASSRCLDNNVDDEEINSSLSLKIFNDNLTSLMFRDSNPVRLRDGRTIKELTCVENCMVRVDRVNCSRRADSLVWRCVSPSLQRSSYCFDNTFIVCDNLESADESSGRGIGETGCYMHYSLKTKDADEFDFSLLLVVLVCFVTIALFVELLKRWFDCQTPIVINTRECSAKIAKRKPDLPLRTAFSSVPPAVLTNVLTQDLNLDRKSIDLQTKSPIGDNYI